MSWTMPEDWAEDFDPKGSGWVAATGDDIRVLFGDLSDRRGWSGGQMKQRDFWHRPAAAGVETLVVEWVTPWREVLAVIRDGVVFTNKPVSKEAFDSLWKEWSGP